MVSTVQVTSSLVYVYLKTGRYCLKFLTYQLTNIQLA
uniref:Uncharacterized protein n=1 Tax=Arundo donax TaxID=35708 RepID=A0A0A9A6S6_ARUDO